MGNPISISNGKYELIEASGHKPYAEPLWDEIANKKYIPINSRKYLNVIKNAYAMPSGKPEIKEAKGMRHRVMAVKLAVPNGFYMLFALEAEKAFSPSDNEILAAVGTAVVDILRNLAGKSDHDILFLTDLLKGEVFDRETLKERSAVLGFGLENPFLLINIHGSFGFGAPLKLRESAEAVFRFSRILIMEDRMLLLTDTRCMEADNGKSLKILRKDMSAHQMHGCVSRSFEDLAEFPAQVRETSRILDAVIRTLTVEPLCFALRHHTLGLLSGLSRDQLIVLCWPPVLELLETDRIKQTNLMDSLYAYVLCFRSIARAAGLKGVHYNTIKKDLHAITTILGEGWERLGAQIFLSVQCLMLLTPESMRECVKIEMCYHMRCECHV
jgi:hypothetical protein